MAEHLTHSRLLVRFYSLAKSPWLLQILLDTSAFKHLETDLMFHQDIFSPDSYP